MHELIYKWEDWTDKGYAPWVACSILFGHDTYLKLWSWEWSGDARDDTILKFKNSEDAAFFKLSYG